MNRLGPVTLLAMLAAAASSAARAQGLQIHYDGAADTVSLQAAGVPFHEVLEALAERAEIELDLPHRPKTPVRIDLTDVPLRTALDELLSGYNYTMTQDGQPERAGGADRAAQRLRVELMQPMLSGRQIQSKGAVVAPLQAREQGRPVQLGPVMAGDTCAFEQVAQVEPVAHVHAVLDLAMEKIVQQPGAGVGQSHTRITAG